MSLTFQQFKVAVRSRCFPSGESRNLRPAHDKSIVDALVDMQRWVDCLQSNNTDLIPHCSTFYKCGLTFFNFRRSLIKRLSVIDKINPTTHKEDATAADDYCTEIVYRQIDACQMEAYLSKSLTIGCCASFGAYFPIPDVWSCGKLRAPVPTGEGVLDTLPSLPLGYHYPQESTNSACGRSRVGVWAKNGAGIYVAPWIQGTETIVIKWDGIKREWVDADLVSDDPGVLRAVELFLRWEHARDWDKNPAVGAGYENEYRKALAELMYDCAQEGMVRDCGSERDLGANSSGRDGGMSPPSANAVEDCSASGGAPIPPDDSGVSGGGGGSGGSGTVTYNTNELSATVSCADGWPPSGDAPPPTGPTVTVTVYKNTVPSTSGETDANQLAENLLEQKKLDALSGQCTFHCQSVTRTATCPDGTTVYSSTVAAGDPDCDSVYSQADADGKAAAKAQQLANAQLSGCPDPAPARFCNTAIPYSPYNFTCQYRNDSNQLVACTLRVVVICPAGVADGTTQQKAQQAAGVLITQAALNWRTSKCAAVQIAKVCPPPVAEVVTVGPVWCTP